MRHYYYSSGPILRPRMIDLRNYKVLILPSCLLINSMSPLECVHFRSHGKRRLQRGANYFGRSLVNHLVLNDLCCLVAIVAILPGPRGQRVVTFIAFFHRHTPIEENFQTMHRRAGKPNFLWRKLASVSCNICRLCFICASSSAPWPKYKKIKYVRFSSVRHISEIIRIDNTSE